MKNSALKIIFTFAIACVATSLANAAPSAAVTNSATAKAPVVAKTVPKSTFSVPAKPTDGHDPFFPQSDRLFAVKSESKRSQSTPATLVFNGVSGPQDHRLAIISGHTFAEGEEASVTTASGRVHVRCIEIKDEVAIIEVAGERRELRFQDR